MAKGNFKMLIKYLILNMSLESLYEWQRVLKLREFIFTVATIGPLNFHIFSKFLAVYTLTTSVTDWNNLFSYHLTYHNSLLFLLLSAHSSAFQAAYCIPQLDFNVDLFLPLLPGMSGDEKNVDIEKQRDISAIKVIMNMLEKNLRIVSTTNWIPSSHKMKFTFESLF